MYTISKTYEELLFELFGEPLPLFAEDSQSILREIITKHLNGTKLDVIISIYFDGLSGAQISHNLGISSQSVYYYRNSAIKKLKECDELKYITKDWCDKINLIKNSINTFGIERTTVKLLGGVCGILLISHIKTIGQLTRHTKKSLMYKGVSEYQIKLIEEILHRFNLSLVNHHDYPYNLISDMFEVYYPNIVPNIDKVICEITDTLKDKEQEIIMMRYVEHKNIGDIAKSYGVTSNRIRQIIQKSLRKMKHWSRSKRIITDYDFWEKNKYTICRNRK